MNDADDIIMKIKFKGGDMVNDEDFRCIMNSEYDRTDVSQTADQQTVSLYRRLAKILYDWDRNHNTLET
jgi:hypothetical protein